MTILETNVIIRHLAQDNPEQHTRADALFQRLERGEVSLRLPQGVLVESVQVLESKVLYHTPREQIRIWLSDLIRLPAVKMTNKQVHLRALELYVSYPRLSFVDSLCVAYAEREPDKTVMTFDQGFKILPGITRREP